MKSSYVSNMIFHRNEHNIAVLQMKTILQFSNDSPYLPICLPPMCDNTCRTRSGQTQEKILGKTAVSMNAGYRSIYNLKVISGAQCQELVEDFALQSDRTMRKIKRWQ